MNREAYNFLNRVRVLHWEYLRLKAKHDELMSCLLPGAIRYDKDKVQTSPDDTMSKVLAEIAALEERMETVNRSKSQQIEKISKVINALESEEERTALSMRYINRIPVDKIANAMGYSTKRVYQFMDHGGAVIAKRLDKLEK